MGLIRRWTEWEDGARRVIAGLRQDANPLRKVAAELADTDSSHASGISSLDPGVV